MAFLGVAAGVKAAAASYNPAAKFSVKVSEVEYRRTKVGRQLLARIYEPARTGPFPTVLDLHEDWHLRQFERRPCCGVARHAAAGFPVQPDPLSEAPSVDASVAYVAMRSPISNTFARYQNAEKLKRSAMVRNNTTFFVPWDTIHESDPQEILDRHETITKVPFLIMQVRRRTVHRRRRCHSLHSNYMLNRGYAYTTIISKCHGPTLLSHLASLYPHSTPQAWQQKLNNGEVTLNGVTVTGSESVTLGQTLVWNRPPWIEPDSPQHFEVLFEDPHMLAVNKPSGLPTLPGGGFMENTLLRCVQRRTPNANPVHRLGRATTGIVLFAKTPQAASNLFANWNIPDIQKIYRALGQNIAQHDAYEIVIPIGLVPHPLIGSVWAASPGGKPSKSLAKVISRGISRNMGATTF